MVVALPTLGFYWTAPHRICILYGKCNCSLHRCFFSCKLHFGYTRSGDLRDHRTPHPQHTQGNTASSQGGEAHTTSAGQVRAGTCNSHAPGQAPYILSLRRVHRTHAAPRPLRRRRALPPPAPARDAAAATTGTPSSRGRAEAAGTPSCHDRAAPANLQRAACCPQRRWEEVSCLPLWLSSVTSTNATSAPGAHVQAARRR